VTPPGAQGLTAMARETRECPDVAARLLAARAGFERVARRLDLARAPLAVICGRGSSGHAGVHLRYLIETRLGLPVSATAPSVTTALHRPLKLEGALFIVMSQSGGSPDLVAATAAARGAGAQTVAFVNVADSPVAAAAEHVLPLLAGPEVAVAATKSVVAAMLAGALLVEALSDDAGLRDALDRLPARFDKVLALDWSALQAMLAGAPCACIAGRGFGLGSAREIALKCAETLRLPTLAYSAAELRHGPRAALTRQTPVLALRLADETSDAVDALVRHLGESDVPVAVAGGPATTLPWISDDHPVTDAITMLMPAYRAIEAAARSLGHDPDRPPFLSKVTRTL
jgi:glutamine---fructose-6-phosphate transaminase (isomerizing)